MKQKMESEDALRAKVEQMEKDQKTSAEQNEKLTNEKKELEEEQEKMK